MAAKVLMACVNYWTSPFQVGSHHLARQFLRSGYDVAFVSEPITPLHILARRGTDLSERWRLYRQNGHCSEDNRLWTYVPGALLAPQNRPGLRGNWMHENWWRLTLPSVVGTVIRHGFGTVDVLYLDSVKQAFWLGQVRAHCSVYRVADHNAGFDTFTPAMQRLEERLIRSVDIVAYSSERLGDAIRKLGPKRMVYLPNGVDFNRFQNECPAPPEYATLPRPRIIYVGAMEAWFDYRLLAYAASQLSEASFVMIGPDRNARARLAGLPNVHLLGPRPHCDIPGYLQHADVGIIPFDVAGHPELVHAVNPLKLYEYLACGLPVVATEWEALSRLRAPAHLATSPAQFVTALRQALSAGSDRAALRNFAKDRDWSRCAAPLLQLLDTGSSRARSLAS